MPPANRILLVFAHPDDETFCSGATIAKYAKQGDTVISLLCATRGQAGKVGEPPLCTREELPRVREEELRRAASILGIHHVEVLDHEDKHLSDLPASVLAQDVKAAILRHLPQVVITFAPHGISGHPDHRAISSATNEAVTALAKSDSPVRKLYHCTLPDTAPTHGATRMNTDPVGNITTEIAAPECVPLVAQALLAYRTQHMSIERVFPGVFQGNYENVQATNYYILAWHNLPGYRPEGKETDLFAGLTHSFSESSRTEGQKKT